MNMLQFITHKAGGYDELSGAEAVLKGGCRWVQLRMKDASDEEFIAVGRKLAELCRSFGARLILDDRVHLVGEIGADGVHVGKNDMPVDEVRRLLGPGFIVGATANSFDDIASAAARGADYIGLGPFRFTQTKRKLSPILGLEGYRQLMSESRAAGILLPVVAIGGINSADIPDIMATGVHGVAISGGLLRAEDTVTETRNILSELESYGASAWSGLPR
ncbi:MAG TPA: thiamine phosphate synthase [Candidatus Cryptobacteroides merdipullorum]|uniref:Thiamine-phosphate synthase n=1 Tax=Candidatus Cryptobacteroides merdipullorum TaxID=2840771 RepID=A0A9D1GNN2_9BACT|nr:thiamine phosphate synthase [Candidatus Cryptobacteroides merdipullorum]